MLVSTHWCSTPPPCCLFTRHLGGNMVIQAAHVSTAHIIFETSSTGYIKFLYLNYLFGEVVVNSTQIIQEQRHTVDSTNSSMWNNQKSNVLVLKKEPIIVCSNLKIAKSDFLETNGTFNKPWPSVTMPTIHDQANPRRHGIGKSHHFLKQRTEGYMK